MAGCSLVAPIEFQNHMNMDREPASSRGRWVVLALYGCLIAALIMAWQNPELRQHLQPQALANHGKALLEQPMGTLWVLLAYVCAVVAGVPTSVMATVGVMVFGPWPGVAYALMGMVSGALLVYGVGRYSGAAFIDRWARTGRLHTLATVLQKEGLWAVFVVRAVPLAPFVLVSMTAGAFRIRFWHYVVGTALGLAPGTVMMGLFWDRVKAALEHPNWATYSVLLFMVALIAFTVRWFKRKLAQEQLLQE
jgi:uncharacterized membrane protein YdjX (TVP38/TMEM64 family)